MAGGANSATPAADTGAGRYIGKALITTFALMAKMDPATLFAVPFDWFHRIFQQEAASFVSLAILSLIMVL